MPFVPPFLPPLLVLLGKLWKEVPALVPLFNCLFPELTSHIGSPILCLPRSAFARGFPIASPILMLIPWPWLVFFIMVRRIWCSAFGFGP